MRTQIVATAVIVAASLAVFGRITLAQQDRYTLKAPDGLAFSEFKGYDAWEDVAVSETQGSVKAILGNPTMIGAYKEGIPDNGKSFPEGVKIVKIEWTKKKIRYRPISSRYQTPLRRSHSSRRTLEIPEHARMGICPVRLRYRV